MTDSQRFLAPLFVMLLCNVSGAANRNWLTSTDASWQETANWQDGQLPNAGDVASFMDLPATDATITVDQAANLGGLRYVNWANTIFDGDGPLIFDNGTSPAVIENERQRSGYLGIATPIVLQSDLTVFNQGSTRIDLNGGITSASERKVNVTLESNSNAGFEVLGGLAISGDLSIVRSQHAFFAGDLQFEDLTLQASRVTFESPFSTQRLQLREDSVLRLERPVTVQDMVLGGGLIEGPGSLEVVNSTIALGGVVDFDYSGSLYGTKLVKEGTERLTLLNLGPDLQHDVLVREGELWLEYPDPRSLPAGQGPGTVRLDASDTRLVIASVPEASVGMTIDLNNILPVGTEDGALAGSATLTGPLLLGDRGASISGSFNIRGPISGGSLIVKGAQNLQSDGHTLTGDVIVDGRLNLVDSGQLTTPRSIWIRDGQLMLSASRQRVDESIPFLLDRGTLVLQDSSTEPQRIGAVTVRGRGLMVVESDLRMSSLDVFPDATLALNAVDGSVYVDDWETTDLLPANIRRGDEFAGYDPERGIVAFTPALEFDETNWTDSTDAGVQDNTVSESTLVRTLSFPDISARLEIQEGAAVNVLTGGVRLSSAPVFGVPAGSVVGAGRITAGGTEAGRLYLVAGTGTGGEFRIAASITDNSGPDSDPSTSLDNGAVSLLIDSHVVLSGVNTYSGTTDVVDRVLTIEAPHAISPNSEFVIRSNGSVHIPYPETAEFGAILLDGGSLTGDGRFQADSLTIRSGYPNRSITGPTPIVKQTSGEAHISIDSGFAGTLDHQEGLLRLQLLELPDQPFSEYQPQIQVASGAELWLTSDAANGAFAGTGTINHLSFNRPGGSVSPGVDDSVGTLHVGDLQVRRDSVYQWQLAQVEGVAGEDWDFLQLDGLFVDDDSTWTVQLQGEPARTVRYRLSLIHDRSTPGRSPRSRIPTRSIFAERSPSMPPHFNRYVRSRMVSHCSRTKRESSSNTDVMPT